MRAPRSSPPVARRARSRGRRGAVLIAVICILAILAVFAVSFASVLRLESRAAANVRDSARARLAAEAGLERAVFLLTESELSDPVRSFHAPWTYRSQDGSTWGLTEPLEGARNPSFAAGTLETAGRAFAYSGAVSGTYCARGDQFVLKVVDAASRLSLNGRQPSLPSMLDALGRAVLEFDTRRRDPGDALFDAGHVAWVAARRADLQRLGVSPARIDAELAPRDPVAGRGEAIVALREGQLGGRFTSVAQLLGVLPASDLERLDDFVTADAWLDPAMIGLRPQPDGTVREVGERRAPVNVNTASWPVLVACFQGVRAARPVHALDTDLEVTPALARALATRLDELRRGRRVNAQTVDPPGEALRGWLDLERLLDDLRASGAVPLNLTQRAALLANANPNLVYAPRNPDAPIHPGLGKVDLAARLDAGGRVVVGYTTELSFISYGIYEVTSLGRVVGPDGEVVAEANLQASVAVYDTLRLLTQADFEAARTSDEVEQTASFPNPVRSLTGAYRVQAGGDDAGEVMYEPIADPGLRRDLRVQTASSRSGHAQLIAAEPLVPLPPSMMEELWNFDVHLFRFGADLRGDVFWWQRLNVADDDGGWETRPRRLDFTVPPLQGYAPGSVIERLRDFAAAAGVPPDIVGGAGSPPAGSGRLVYREDLGPDGLLVHPGRTADLRYANLHQPESPMCGVNELNPPWCGAHSILGGRSAIALWFKLNQSDLNGPPGSAPPWTPLLEAWCHVEGTYARDPATTWVKHQVEARLTRQASGEGYWLEVRSRRCSRLTPRIYAPPDGEPPNPDAELFNRGMFAVHTRLGLDEARASEWHHLFLPYYANVHHPFVDGQCGEVVGRVTNDDPDSFPAAWGWPIPNWPADLDPSQGTRPGVVAPGGFVYEGSNRPRPYVEATVDDLTTSGYQLLIRPPRPPEEGDEGTFVFQVRDLPGMLARRFYPLGPDHVGSFTAELPPFDRDVQIGRLLWSEHLPAGWGRRAFEDGDFQSQSSYRYSSDAQRNHLSGRRIDPPPSPQRAQDEYVRYWRLRYLRERKTVVLALAAQYERLAALAQGDRGAGDPLDDASRRTFLAYEAAFRAEVAALDAEEQELLGDPPREPAPPPEDAGSSLAFGSQGVVSPEGRAVRLRIDFIYYDRAIGPPPPPAADGSQPPPQTPVLNVSPVLEDVILPYQERPRVLRFEWE